MLAKRRYRRINKVYKRTSYLLKRAPPIVYGTVRALRGLAVSGALFKEKRVLILCKKCGNLFNSLARNALYCQKCRGTVRYYTVNKTVVKFCETCGAKIKTSRKNQRFCNDRCRAAYHFPKVESIVQCAYCGKTFVATTAKKKYCGMSCYDGAKRLRDEERRKDKSE